MCIDPAPGGAERNERMDLVSEYDGEDQKEGGSKSKGSKCKSKRVGVHQIETLTACILAAWAQ